MLPSAVTTSPWTSATPTLSTSVPPTPNVGSSDPSAAYRTSPTVVVPPVPAPAPPSSSVPSGWTTTSYAWRTAGAVAFGAAAFSTTPEPSPPNVPSGEPSGLYRATAWEATEPVPTPAATIFPSGWRARSNARSSDPPGLVTTRPSVPNAASGVPSGLYRASANA